MVAYKRVCGKVKVKDILVTLQTCRYVFSVFLIDHIKLLVEYTFCAPYT